MHILNINVYLSHRCVEFKLSQSLTISQTKSSPIKMTIVWPIDRIADISPRKGGNSTLPPKSNRQPAISESAKQRHVESNPTQQSLSGLYYFCMLIVV